MTLHTIGYRCCVHLPSTALFIERVLLGVGVHVDITGVLLCGLHITTTHFVSVLRQCVLGLDDAFHGNSAASHLLVL